MYKHTTNTLSYAQAYITYTLSFFLILNDTFDKHLLVTRAAYDTLKALRDIPGLQDTEHFRERRRLVYFLLTSSQRVELKFISFHFRLTNGCVWLMAMCLEEQSKKLTYWSGTKFHPMHSCHLLTDSASTGI